MTKTVILCDCLSSQKLDRAALQDASGVSCSRVHNFLCGDQIGEAGKAIAGGDVIIACQQERQRFEELADDLGAEAPGFVDLRDRAGWSDDARAPMPKMAALLAEAAIEVPGVKTMDVLSEGTCLIIGEGDTILPVARELCEMLAVTALVTDAAEPDEDRRFDMIRGRLKRATGALGQFQVEIDAFQQVIPGGRGPLTMTPPRDGALSDCDIILDLSGGQPLFAAPGKREGYLRADPKSAPAVAHATLAASQLIGTFEKPLYVTLEPTLCAHSRAGQPACSRCLNLCPTGAISPDGDHVTIDPMICAGCGSCAAVCPSGAIAYDAPPVDTVFRRLSTLAGTYRSGSGGEAPPRLLVHDDGHGAEMIRLAARHGRGLPADVIPFETTTLAGFGHAEMLAALACGFGSVDILFSPGTERDAPMGELALARAIVDDDVLGYLDPDDPDHLSAALFDQAPAPAAPGDPILPMGSRRQVARLAARALRPGETMLALPEGAPYGAVLVDTEACSLCLSCVSLCPSGALGDNADMPQLRFQEDACLQCGLCANICPEDAITLAPRLTLDDSALSQRVLHEEEPFACVECGKLFGVKSTVEKITEKLAGKHSMFASSQAARMIQMCDDCRVNAQMHMQNNPFGMGDQPRTITADDYLSKRRDH